MDIKIELDNINLSIKILGLNVKYGNEDDLESQLRNLDQLEKDKKILEKKYQMSEYKKNDLTNKTNQSLNELSLKKDLNVFDTGGEPGDNLKEKIENHKTYLLIYDEKYNLIKKSLKIVKRTSSYELPYFMKDLKYPNEEYVLHNRM
jgi:hypothetical protein|tara:strand:- start:444 stop:884 length:441 start_codon:yes stop_codon:yes gene_type:complete